MYINMYVCMYVHTNICISIYVYGICTCSFRVYMSPVREYWVVIASVNIFCVSKHHRYAIT